jgi:hypothetical protein
VFLTGKKEITYMCKRLTLTLKKINKKRTKIEAEDSDESGFEEENDG